MLALLVVLMLPSVFIAGCASITGEVLVAETQVIDITVAEEAYVSLPDNADNSDFIITDVRTPGQYPEGHIERAINLDYNSDTFRDDVGALDRDKTYFIYCRSGRRSLGAVEIMRELGFGKVYHLTGGILQWEEAGLPTIK